MHRELAALAGEPATAHEVRVVQDEIEQLRSEPGLSDNLVKNLAKALCLEFPPERDERQAEAKR